MAERFRRRELAVDGIQIVLGRTTRREVLDFCPDANVGAPGTDEDPYGYESSDLKWLTVPFVQSRYEAQHLTGDSTQPMRDGDWLLKDADGKYFAVSDEQIKRDFERMPF